MGRGWAVTTDHLVPGRKRRECCEPGNIPTLHGVVFAILYLGPALHCGKVFALRPVHELASALRWRR